ncbi:mannan endo-1,4-beta-mannosidase 4-like [Vicia villosa]|uniref:mannan endo-1,4-beta-mannosidase 4-like n=1 Tax=Vicia villosa TaxID=3911 RepID=UPI00273BC513|nr:mannan endo-1,4-beta-mannosidase 4-like [Vicia villosa]
MGYQIFVLTYFLVSFIVQHGNCQRANVDASFVQREGTHFVLNGKPHYVNGFNAYWFIIMASDPSTRPKVTSAFEQASKHGLNLGRAFAFNEGDYKPLQVSPGSYDENVFKGLDFVISEARKFGVKLILGFVNNWKALGGKSKYVEWARERGQNITNEDDFFTHPVVKQYYKNHIKTVLTRKNTINGLLYKDDPTIFSWELINEPRVNQTGKSIQNWVSEMAKYVKSIDSNHLLEIGLEGLYGESKQQLNPYSMLVGTDFISNNQIPEIDFSTIHAYQEYWLNKSNQSAAIDKWIEDHIQDANTILQKPIIVTEFGMSSKTAGYSIDARDAHYKEIYSIISTSATSGGSCAGAMFWQLLAQGIESYGDGFEVILENSPSTAKIIKEQSTKMSNIKL